MTRASGCSSSFASLLFLSAFDFASGEAFLGRRFGHQDFDAELQAAMASVMGCGAPAGAPPPYGHVDDAKLALLPLWRTLPANRWGRVDWAMVRYASHRYFMQQYGLLVKGFEPTRSVNSSALGTAEILSGEAHPMVEALLKGKVDGKGFSLDDVAFMLATLERVIHDGEGANLERAYRAVGWRPSDLLSRKAIAAIIEAYMLIWMLGDEQELANDLIRHPELRSEAFPEWTEVCEFAHGVVRRMEFEAHRTPQPGSGRVAMQGTYSFKDVHGAIGYITLSFASFTAYGCRDVKASLVALDQLGVGRVAVSDFYGANSDGEWRFGESEAYLRELGALDETSATRGNQVIISNYLQGASNCVTTAPYYMVCCANECEEVLNDIHGSVGAPVASAEAISGLVQQMLNFDDEAPFIDGRLKRQLRRIEEMHGGSVPLHGRLFAQWLHYVFPRECPFPHKAGTASPVAIGQYGDDAYATTQDIQAHSARRNMTSAKISQVEKEQWMQKWSDSEELDVNFPVGLAPWEHAVVGTWLGYGGCATAVLGVACSMVAAALKAWTDPIQEPARSACKAHSV